MNKLLLLLVLSFSVSAYDQFKTVDSVEVIEITENEDGTLGEEVISRTNVAKSYYEDTYETYKLLADPKDKMGIENLGEIITIAGEIVGLGKEVYDLVQLGKPVVNVDTAPISVLPMNLDKDAPVAALSLSNWKEPVVKKYRIKVKNYLGMTAIDFRWKIIFSHGGKYNDKGAFITGAVIKPEFVDVSYGYDLNVNYKLQSISNVGSTEAPIAQAIIDLDFKIETVLKTTIRSQSYLIDGLGRLKSL